MTLLVYGAGGLGLYFAARLAQSGHEVILKARRDTSRQSMHEPIRISKDGSTEEVHNIHVVDSLEGVRAQGAIITTKAWQVDDAARDLSAAITNDAPILTTQNGIDAPTRAARFVSSDRVFASTVVVIAERTGPLNVRVVGPEASITVGSIANRPPSDANRITRPLAAAGISTDWTDDIVAALWKKLALICSYGGVGAALDRNVGESRADARICGLVETAMSEVFSVAIAEGASLSESDLADDMDIFLHRFSPQTTSSMHRDLVAGRPSELEDQVGAVVHRAKSSRVATPVLDFIYASMAPCEASARRNA
ncbi:ketopantoate reductase family protein [Brevibacterium luteolum]|uniref:ketopantoate reductase family protein n=1 Tax=Brevibacterium luteolum TaxID=199591 RepID=UPI001C242805|nr:ketopantoate reductase family protein [Brevibacterium luteolum]MBU8578366.1 ketopantoate reductase family protein [Brevibacterium luteolum]